MAVTRQQTAEPRVRDSRGSMDRYFHADSIHFRFLVTDIFYKQIFPELFLYYDNNNLLIRKSNTLFPMVYICLVKHHTFSQVKFFTTTSCSSGFANSESRRRGF